MEINKLITRQTLKEYQNPKKGELRYLFISTVNQCILLSLFMDITDFCAFTTTLVQ